MKSDFNVQFDYYVIWGRSLLSVSKNAGDSFIMIMIDWDDG